MATGLILVATLLASVRLGLLRRLDRVTVFHVWLLYSAFASVGAFGLLAARWPLAIMGAFVGLYWWFSARGNSRRLGGFLPLVLGALALASCAYSLTLEYTFLRAIGLVLLLTFATVGGSALLVDRRNHEALFASLSIGLAIPAFYILLGGSPEGWSISNDARLAAGTVRATGAANFVLTGMIFAAFPSTHGTRKTRFFARLTWLAFLLALLATRSRGAMAAALVILPLQHIAVHGRRGVVHCAAFYTLLLAAAVPLITTSGSAESALRYFRLDDPEEVLGTRVENRWDVLLPKALERPLLGRGFGTARFFLDNDQFAETQDLGIGDRGAAAHNQYLSVFYELGASGLLLFLMLLTYYGWHGFSALVRAPTSPERTRVACLFFFYLQALMDMMFHDGRLTVGNGFAYWFWFVAVFLVASQRSPTWRVTLKRRQAERVPAAAVLEGT